MQERFLWGLAVLCLSSAWALGQEREKENLDSGWKFIPSCGACPVVPASWWPRGSMAPARRLSVKSAWPGSWSCSGPRPIASNVKAAIEGEGRLTGFVNSNLRRTAPFTSCEETRISGGPWPSCRPRVHRAPFVCVSMWREWKSPSLLNFLLPHGSRGMCPAFRVPDRNRTGRAGRTGGTRRGRGVLKQHVDRSLEKKM